MKKFIVLTIAMLLMISLSAQVKSFSVVSSKTYEDQTRTSYISINADLDDDLVYIIEKEMEQHPDISRFSFYAKPDYSECMFTTNISIDEQIVVDLINDIIYSSPFDNSSTQRDFKNRGFVHDLNLTKFELNSDIDSDLLHEIMITFKESDIIIDVDYIGNSRFTVTSKDIIYPVDIENLLVEWDLEIIKEDIK